MLDLGTPLGGHVLKGGGRHYREADEEHVRLWIREGAETIVVLLPRRIPQPQGHRHPVAYHRGGVVVEHSRNIFPWEGVCGVGYEHAGLADRAVPHHHALDRPSGGHRQIYT